VDHRLRPTRPSDTVEQVELAANWYRPGRPHIHWSRPSRCRTRSHPLSKTSPGLMRFLTQSQHAPALALICEGAPIRHSPAVLSGRLLRDSVRVCICPSRAGGLSYACVVSDNEREKVRRALLSHAEAARVAGDKALAALKSLDPQSSRRTWSRNCWRQVRRFLLLRSRLCGRWTPRSGLTRTRVRLSAAALDPAN
jgi:hypothetical protein